MINLFVPQILHIFVLVFYNLELLMPMDDNSF